MNNNNEPKRLVKEDKTVMLVWEGKLHSWDKPALIPQGDNKKREYYIHGIKFTEKAWKERKSERTGLPWFKQSGNSARS